VIVCHLLLIRRRFVAICAPLYVCFVFVWVGWGCLSQMLIFLSQKVGLLTLPFSFSFTFLTYATVAVCRHRSFFLLLPSLQKNNPVSVAAAFPCLACHRVPFAAHSPPFAVFAHRCIMFVCVLDLLGVLLTL
jgi:hypothetical protein